MDNGMFKSILRILTFCYDIFLTLITITFGGKATYNKSLNTFLLVSTKIISKIAQHNVVAAALLFLVVCCLNRASYSIAWNQPQLRAMLQKDISSCLLGVDTDTIVSDDGTKGKL